MEMSGDELKGNNLGNNLIALFSTETVEACGVKS